MSKLKDQESELQAPKLPAKVVFSIDNVEVNKAMLQTKVDEAMLISIDGTKDKESMDKATKLRGELRTARTGVEKHRKAIAEPFNVFLKDLKLKSDELGEIARVGETHLDNEIKRIEKIKEDEKAAKETAKLVAMQARITELMALGAKFDGISRYSFEYDPTLSINTLQLKDFEEEEWNEWLEEVKASFAEEQTRLLEEEENAKKEKIATVNRAAENLAKARELEDKRTALRLKELKINGFTLNAERNTWHYDGLSLDHGVIEIKPDDEWDKMIEDALAGVFKYTAPVEEEVDVLDQVDAKINTPATFEEEPLNVNCMLSFSSIDKSFIEVDISEKFSIRLFPAIFSESVYKDDPAVVANAVVERDLALILIKK